MARPLPVASAPHQDAIAVRKARNEARTAREKPPNIREYIPATPRVPPHTRPAPTPWMNLTAPSTQIPYRCRLLVKRKSGALHIEFDDEPHNPPDAAGRSVFLHSARPGYFSFIQAGHALLRASKWDPTCVPGTRAVWNTNAVEYSRRIDYADTIALYIERLVNPKKGRPGREITRDELAAAKGNPMSGLRTGYRAARSKRRNEILSLAQRYSNAILELLGHFDNPRSMVGYTREEQKVLLQFIGEVRVATDALRDVVFSDKLVPVRVSAPLVQEQRFRPVNTLMDTVREEMTHDFDHLLFPDVARTYPPPPPLYVPPDLKYLGPPPARFAAGKMDDFMEGLDK